MKTHPWILVAIVAVGAGCTDEAKKGPTGCTTSSECEAGWACSSGECIKVCITAADCPGEQICVNDRCADVQPSDLPEITLVTGNDAVDPTRVRDGLRVTGARLTDAVFALEGDLPVALTVRSQTETSAELVLPADILSGTYLLVATNAAGSDQEPIELTLPELTGDVLVTRINDAATTERIALDRLAEPVQPLLDGDMTVAMINDAATTGRIERDRLAEPVQVRVDPGCPAGESIRSVNADGSVVCETHLTLLDVQQAVETAIAATWDTDGDGVIDAAVLPAGMFQNRISGGRAISLAQPGASTRVRKLTFLKTQPTTVLEITSFDVGGPHMSGSHAQSHHFEFSLDDKLVALGAGYQSNGGTGWNMWPRMHRTYVDDLPVGVHELEIVHTLDSADNYSYAWSGSNHVEVREIAATEVRTITRFASDQRNTAATLTPVSDRSLAFTKQGDTSVPVLVTIHDTWGSLSNTETGGVGCLWVLYVDGTPTREVVLHHSADDGYTIYPATLGWLVEGLDAGSHDVELNVRMEAQSSQCLNGWASRGDVNIRELDPTQIAYVNNLADVQVAGDWQAVPGRSVTYTKLAAAAVSDVRILWMDNIGFDYGGTPASACEYRVIMDGDQANPVATASEHAAQVGGWRLKSIMAEFIVEGVAPGSHNFTLEWKSEAGAAACRNGWSLATDAAANFFMAMETPR